MAEATFDHNEFGWEMGWTARAIALGHGFSSPFLPFTGPTALVPPVYPYFLALVFRLLGVYTAASAFAILTFNSLCSAGTCIPLYFLVRRALNTRVARLTTIAWAVYPFAIYFSASRVWDYALTGLLLTCSMLLAQRLHLRAFSAWIAFGLLAGISVLSNPSIFTLLVFFGCAAAFKVWRIGGAWQAKALLAVLAFTAVCLPWTVRNHRVMHSTFFIRDGFWIEFYAGNNGTTLESNDPRAHPASNPLEMQKYIRMGEIAYIAEKHDLAITFLRHHPMAFVASTIHRIVRFWTGYWSLQPDYLRFEPLDLPNIPFCVFLFWALLRGIRRFWRDNPFAALPYILAVLVFPIPYYLTHASMDYRQPLEPIIITLVSIGLFGAHDDTPETREETRLELATETV